MTDESAASDGAVNGIGALILDDGPLASLDDDFLFKDHVALATRLDRIARRLVKPITSATAWRALTFAVNGPWGSGKSSALEYIRRRAEGLLDDDRSELFTTVRIHAPTYDTTEDDARGALMFELVNSLPVGQQKAIRTLATGLFKQGGGEVPPHADEQTALLLDNWILRNAMMNRGGWHHFESAIQVQLDTMPADNRALAVFIDELDRCRPEFTATMLAATNRWSRVDNLSFVLAADSGHLDLALREHVIGLGEGGDPTRSPIEKYVQFSVTLPRLVEDRQQQYLFLESQLERVTFSDEDAHKKAVLSEWLTDSPVPGRRSAPSSPFRQRLRSSRDDADENNLHRLEPLLRKPTTRTPRGLKREFNRLLVEIDRGRTLNDEFLKRYVIELVWPDFSDEYVWRYEALPQDVRLWLAQLQAVGEEVLPYWSRHGFQTAVDTVRHVVALRNISTGDVSHDLIVYLGLEPKFFDPRPIEETSAQPPPPFKPVETMPEAAGEGETDVENTLSELDISVRALSEQGPPPEYLEMLDRAVQLVRDNVDQLGPRAADWIGNIALNAELRGQIGTARELFEYADLINRDHPNNMLNFISFILDQEQEDLYGRAAQYLRRLEDDHANFKPGRRVALSVQYHVAVGERYRGDPDEAIEIVHRAFEDNPSVGRLSQTLPVYGYFDRLEEAEALARGYIMTLTAPRELAVALRALADVIAQPDKDETEWRAIAIYNYMLASGLACLAEDMATGGAMIKGVRRMLGVLLYRQKQHATGIQQLAAAYERAADDLLIRRTLSSYLLNLGFPEEAREVISGRPLVRVPDITNEDNAAVRLLPPREQQWWFELRLPSGLAPCEPVVDLSDVPRPGSAGGDGG